MIDPNDLWIGDLLLLKKSKRIGKFDGMKDKNTLRIKIDDKIIISKLSNIELAPESSESNLNLLESTKVSSSLEFFEPIIDLHIENLNPSLEHALPERIVAYQVSAAKKFIEKAILRRVAKIEIIHGKGTGVLKSETLHLLKDYKEVQFTFEKNQGGSTEVILTF